MRLLRALPLVLACLTDARAAEPLPDATGREVALSRPEWVLFIPEDYSARPDGKVDLLVHFHGWPPVVRNNLAHARLNAVLVTVNYNGLSSVYRIPFSESTLFQTLLDNALEKLREEEGFSDASWDKIALSSFSAGYGAVREILKSPNYRERVSAILAADSLYASTDDVDGTPVDAQMADYKLWSELSTGGEKVFVFTHTRVETPTYESTEETGDELLAHLGLDTTPTEESGLGPLSFYRKARRGEFHFWGSPGKTGEDHMDHLRYMAEWLDDLGLASLPSE